MSVLGCLLGATGGTVAALALLLASCGGEEPHWLDESRSPDRDPTERAECAYPIALPADCWDRVQSDQALLRCCARYPLLCEGCETP